MERNVQTVAICMHAIFSPAAAKSCVVNHLLCLGTTRSWAHCEVVKLWVQCTVMVATLQNSALLTQAPPTLDEDNFPSLANSPSPSPRAATNSPAQANGVGHATAPETDATAVVTPDESESPKAAPAKLPSAWGAVEGGAHKAASTPEKSSAVWKSESMSSQQKAQAASSKLQPGAATFKASKKSASKVPWVETGPPHLCNNTLVCTVTPQINTVHLQTHLRVCSLLVH